MTDPLDLEPIKHRLLNIRRGRAWDEHVAIDDDVAALITEIERLRNERGFWAEATQHLAGKRSEEGEKPPG